MTVSITRFAGEAVGRYHGGVVPRSSSAPPPLPLHPNWDDGIKVSTRWLTSIEASDSEEDGRIEDRRALVERPVRRVSGTLQGLTQNETAQILGRSARAVTGEYIDLLPIFPDATKATTVSPSGANYTIGGDFQYKRYYAGQKVLVMYAGAAEVGTVVLAYYNSLLVSDLATQPAVDSIILPLIQTLPIVAAEGELVTDHLARIEIRGNEVPGESALPASWTGEDISSIYPLADEGNTTGRVTPIFDYAINWKDEVGAVLERDGGIRNLGRSAVLSYQGSGAIREFDVDLLWQDREQFWRLLRFFDWAQGRRRSFWIRDLANPWSMAQIGSDFLTTVLYLDYVGENEDLQQYSHFYFKFGGVYYVRKIDSVSGPHTASGKHRINLGADADNWLPFSIGNSGVPIGSIEEFGPIHKCRFSKDEFVENWHCGFAGEANTKFEAVNDMEVDGPDFDHLPIAVNTPDEVADLDIWLTSRANLFAADSDHPGYYLRAQPFLQSVVQRLADARVDIGDTPAIGDIPIEGEFLMKRTSSPWSTVVKDLEQRANNGGNLIMDMTGTLQRLSSGVTVLAEEDKVLWDNAAGKGMTVFLAFGGSQLTKTGGQYESVVKLETWKAPNGMLFDWQASGDLVGNGGQYVSFYTAEGTSSPGHKITAPNIHQRGKPIVLCLRWVPGEVAYLYFNGISTEFDADWAAAGGSGTNPWTTSSALTAVGMPTAAHVLRDWFECFKSYRTIGASPNTPEVRAASDLWGQEPMFTDFISYKRGLSIAEMNQVGNHLADTIGARWEDIV